MAVGTGVGVDPGFPVGAAEALGPADGDALVPGLGEPDGVDVGDPLGTGLEECTGEADAEGTADGRTPGDPPPPLPPPQPARIAKPIRTYSHRRMYVDGRAHHVSVRGANGLGHTSLSAQEPDYRREEAGELWKRNQISASSAITQQTTRCET